MQRTCLAGQWLFTITALAVALLFTVDASKAGPTYTPKAGSAERKAILDALRKPVSKKVKTPVIFELGYFKVHDGWAMVSGSALKANGTRFGDEYLWGEITALLRKEKKSWRVLQWGFASDTSVFDEARKKYPHAPRSIFPGS
ncbi:MAG TPA: hypothetical protein VF600_14580 [Abditibacteriaceae bacterium]|jgi:hypothetical protein